MKILLLSHRFFPDIGGIETVSEMLALEFSSKGHDIHVVTWSRNKYVDNFLFSIIRDPSVFQLQKEFRWADVILENNPSLRMSWLNIFFRKPIVVGLHTWLKNPNSKFGIVERIKLYWLSRASSVVSCSEAIRKRIYEQSIVVGNPYDSDLFRIIPNIKKNKDFIFLGRLVSDKGVSLALDAFNLVLQNHPESTFTIIGDGEEMPTLKLKSKKLGIENNVFFKGSMKGEVLVKCLNEHRYMIVPSLWEEPFGIIVLEGMACGCLPIVSNVGGLPDAIADIGLTFKKGDAVSLKEVMIQVLMEKLSINEIKATNHLKAHHSTYIASEYLAILESVI